MQFTKKLRPCIKSGQVTTSIRLWKKPRVKLWGKYRLDEGTVIVTSIQEISFSDISENLAKESGLPVLLIYSKQLNMAMAMHSIS